MTKDLNEIIAILKENNFFKDLSDSELKKLAKLADVVTVEKGVCLIEENTVSNKFFVVYEGMVQVEKYSHETQSAHGLAILKAGAIVGELTLIDDTPPSASICTMQTTTLLEFKITDIKRLFHRAPKFCGKVYQSLAQELNQKLRRTNEVTLQALQRQLQEMELRVSMGRFMCGAFISIVIYGFSLNFASNLISSTQISTLITLVLLIALMAPIFLAMKQSRYPLAVYGLTMRNWQHVMKETLWYTFLWLVGTTLLKWVAIKIFTFAHPETLFQPSVSFNPKHAMGIFTFLIGVPLYGLVAVPLQEIFSRCLFQRPLELFLTRNSKVLSIILTAMLFSLLHVYVSIFFAALVFPAALFWGWMFARQRTILGVCVSHIIIGIWVTIVLGLPHMA